MRGIQLPGKQPAPALPPTEAAHRRAPDPGERRHELIKRLQVHIGSLARTDSRHPHTEHTGFPSDRAGVARSCTTNRTCVSTSRVVAAISA